jgi:hypothetical protein
VEPTRQPAPTRPAQALQNAEVLKQQDVIKSIQNVLQTNVSVCTSLGQPFVSQMNFIYTDMLQVGCRVCGLCTVQRPGRLAWCWRALAVRLGCCTCAWTHAHTHTCLLKHRSGLVARVAARCLGWAVATQHTAGGICS